MTLRLSVNTAAWNTHVASTAHTLGELLPVVKGNGYGFGRSELIKHAAELASDVAIGTVHEMNEVPATLRPFVLTPVGVGVKAISRHDAVLTVGSRHDLDLLASIGSRHHVVIKVESSMHRYGISSQQATELRGLAESRGHEVVAWSIHLPLTGDDADRSREVVSLMEPLAADIPLHLSHIGGGVSQLRASLRHRVVVRTGTHLWLGDKSMLSLHADVIAVRRAHSGLLAGYRNSVVPHDGLLVMVGCGSSHGVAMLDNGRSPFHFGRRRLDLLEAPHMHTTMLLVPNDSGLREGDWVDVQQPLTRVLPDVTDWN